MLFSLVFRFLSLATLVASLPASNNVQQLAELKAETDAFVANIPPERKDALERYLADVTGTAAGCEDVFLIFVRGTFEPAGTDNLGYVVGMPFLAAMKTGLGANRVGGTGVDYSNSVSGYLSGGDSAGGTTLAKMVSQKALSCPSTKIIVSGYSQGAQVTHNGLKYVSGSVKSHIAGVVVFGDPDKGYPIFGISNSNIFTNCEPSDPICRGIPLPLGSHLTYGTDSTKLNEIVAWIKQRTG